MHDSRNVVMWEGTVRAHDYIGQLTATAEAGFGRLALTPHALRSAVAALGDAASVLAAAGDHGVELSHLDTVTGWAPIRVPTGADADLRRRFDFTVDECLALVDTFGIRNILAVAVFDHDAVPFDDVIRGFGDLCDRARARDVHVDLEFMPFWGVPDLHTACRIIEAANRDNSGIMVDTWHFARGVPDLHLLAHTPAGVPLSVQVADGSKTPIGLDPVEETLHHRTLPGQGQLPLTDILQAILQHGEPRAFGPEVFSDELDKFAPVQAGRLIGRSIRTILTNGD
jgi:sugar phosphate isomerase/epimerase